MDVYFEQHKPTSSVANYLSVGSKTNGAQSLGFELEHFVVEKDSLAAVPYSVEPDSDSPSVEKILEAIKPYYTETVYERDDDGVSHLFGLARSKAAVTLEPGAQLEISVGPSCSIGEVERLYREFRTEIDPVLDSMGLKLLELGYHPTSMASEIPLLPKHRYRYMDEYFSNTGKQGICMMRGSASTQVSVDFNSEMDAMEKFRVANALGPLFAFITDNSPIFEAERVGAYGGSAEISKSGLPVPFRMARTGCWNDTDPLRSMVIKGAFDDDFSFLRYAEVLMESPAIFLPPQSPNAKAEYYGFTTFKEILPDAFISEEMVLHILSLFFFDARFKSYLELRQADALPLEYALAYTALISGIFYNKKALEHYNQCFAYIDATSVAFAKSALNRQGFEAMVYGKSAVAWLDEMIVLAREGLTDEDLPYLEPLAKLIAQRKNLLDLLP